MSEAAADERPLAGYATLTALYTAGLAGALAAAHRNGHELPERVDVGDVALVGVATHKISRLVTKARVTSFIRAPFVEHQRDVGFGEVSERASGEGLRHAVGELLVCPHCISQWVSAGFMVGLVAAPRTTRLVAALYAAKTVADFLQLAYRAAEDQAT